MRFREIRKESGLSVSAVASMLGVDSSTYRKWELETNAISLDMAIRCADIFGCSLDDLAGRTPHNDEELSLINSYRNSSDSGRKSILLNASAISAGFPRGDASSRVSKTA